MPWRRTSEIIRATTGTSSPSGPATADDYAAAGATWLVRSIWPRDEGWRDELEALVDSGPRA